MKELTGSIKLYCFVVIFASNNLTRYSILKQVLVTDKKLMNNIPTLACKNICSHNTMKLHG